MCYSVMVEADLNRLGARLDAKIDLDGLLFLLERRLKGEPLLKIPRGYASFLSQRREPEAKACSDLFGRIDDADRQKFKTKVDQQQQKIVAIQDLLHKKESKTNRQKLAAAQRVLQKAMDEHERLAKPTHSNSILIHQYTYAPILVDEPGRGRMLRFMRYQVRPRWSDVEPPAKINMFNARLDRLEDRKTWAPLFMHRHGALIFKSFFEWVPDPTNHRPRVIRFSARDERILWVPALHESWIPPPVGVLPPKVVPDRPSMDATQRATIDSFAIVTTDPPKDVASYGHDRCPAVRSWDFLATWMRPDLTTKKVIIETLTKEVDVPFCGDWV